MQGLSSPSCPLSSTRAWSSSKPLQAKPCKLPKQALCNALARSVKCSTPKPSLIVYNDKTVRHACAFSVNGEDPKESYSGGCPSRLHRKILLKCQHLLPVAGCRFHLQLTLKSENKVCRRSFGNLRHAMQVAAIRCRFMHTPWWKLLFQHLC